MKIYLSNQGNLRNFQSFISGVDFSNKSYLQITTHDKWITVHPVNLALTAALALEVGRENAEIIGEVPDTGRYLDRMGVYDFIATPSPFKYEKKEETGRFIPLRVIKTAVEQTEFITDIIPLLHLPEKDAKIVEYVIGELVRNVLEHSYAKNGAVVAAQYYKKTNRVSLGICDTGIGLKRSMCSTWQPETDMEAIHLALTPGISGTTLREGGTADNAGAGLFYVKSIAKMSRNYFAICSGRAEYTLLKGDKRVTPKLYSDPREDNHNELEFIGDFHGTLVGVDITLDTTIEFADLLRSIRTIYDGAVRGRKKKVYREPKFI